MKQDHPRICGEKRKMLGRRFRLKGSPPHMRGKGIEGPEPVDLSRITPAYAGKRQRHEQLHPLSGDHPRICGEKPLLRYSGSAGQGSPPHMRGKD